jgi:hypothetical protein
LSGAEQRFSGKGDIKIANSPDIERNARPVAAASYRASLEDDVYVGVTRISEAGSQSIAESNKIFEARKPTW